MKDETFGEVISTYTADDGVEDGLLFDTGTFEGYRVVMTSNLIETLDKYTLASVVTRSLEEVRPLILRSMADIVKVPTEEHMVWADITQNPRMITIMLPEDY